MLLGYQGRSPIGRERFTQLSRLTIQNVFTNAETFSALNDRISRGISRWLSDRNRPMLDPAIRQPRGLGASSATTQILPYSVELISTHVFGWTQGAAVARFWIAPTPLPSPPRWERILTGPGADRGERGQSLMSPTQGRGRQASSPWATFRGPDRAKSRNPCGVPTPLGPRAPSRVHSACAEHPLHPLCLSPPITKALRGKILAHPHSPSLSPALAEDLDGVRGRSRGRGGNH